MLSTKKVLVKNEHGYLTNRGKSRYWGVTTGIDAIGKDYWIVSFNALDLNQTVTLRSPSFTLTETDAARVAAYIYEQGQTYAGLDSNPIRSSCGRYLMHINRTLRSIHRTRYNSEFLVDSTVERLDDHLASGPTTNKPAAPATRSPIPQGPFEVLLALIDRMELTTEQRLQLIARVTAK
jgi:hypothetical protein